MGLRRGAASGSAWAKHGAAHGRTMVLCRSAAWGCACGVRGGVHGGGGGASPQAFGVSPAEALTRRILVPGLHAGCVASPQAVGLAL